MQPASERAGHSARLLEQVKKGILSGVSRRLFVSGDAQASAINHVRVPPGDLRKGLRIPVADHLL
jgi:hypothetical protein